MVQEMITTPPGLRALQLRETELLDEFVRICDRHGLRYCIIAGTLLGAVRHGGFIPWDDDIDVAMPREDYDRFAELCRQELDDRFFYQSSDTDPHYFLTYAKLRRNDTFVYEERFRESQFHKGVFLDIFPLDFCPRPGLVCHFLFNVLAVMNYRGQIDSGEPYVPYEELIGKFGYTVLRLFSPRGLVRLRRLLVRLSARLSSGQYIASYSGAYGYYRDVYPSERYLRTEQVEFEGRTCAAPSCREEVLAQIFGGDYMELPPPEKRTFHIDIGRSRL